MRTRLFILSIVLLLSPFFVAFAEEKTWEAEVGVDLVYPSVLGNTGKFNEYGDLKNNTVNPLGNAKFKYDDQKGYYLNFKMLNPSYETQFYGLDGGRWGSFKYNLFYNEIPHNIEWNARSFWFGAGSDQLNYATPPPTTVQTAPPPSWNYFDFSTVRKQAGGEISVNHFKPFFFKVNYIDEQKKGIRVSGVDLNNSPGGSAAEFPMPIDYHTQGMNLEAGYGKNPFFVSAKYYYQQFKNDNEFVYFRNPSANALTVLTGPSPDIMTGVPDNWYQKFALDGNAKLPFNSVFNAKLAWAEAKSDANLTNYQIIGGVRTPIGLSQPDFDGKVATTNYAFNLTSRPWSFFDGKVFYTYYDKDNKSDEVTFRQGTSTYTNTLFSYNKQTWGADIDWRLMKGLYALTGYKHIKTTRDEREDVPKNQDDLYAVELRYKGLPWLNARIGYEYLKRAADHNGPTAAQLAANIDSGIENWVYRYDVAPVDRDTFKVEATFTPMEDLNFTLGYRYIKNDFNVTTLGLTDDTRNQFKFDVDYTMPKYFHVYGYFDYETTKADQFQRQYTNGTGLTNPYGVSNATNFNWTYNQENKSYDWGFLADIFLIPKKLTLRLQTDYLRSNGSADFTYLTAAALTGGRTNDNMDISAWDDYRTERYIIKLFYNMTPKLSLTAGYSYQRYKSSDEQFQNYQYVTSVPTYLTGVYARPDYSANVYFLGATYQF
jgi:MtrB/PioB family decaheme-associated outer membrane protein